MFCLHRSPAMRVQPLRILAYASPSEITECVAHFGGCRDQRSHLAFVVKTCRQGQGTLAVTLANHGFRHKRQ